MEDTHVSRLEGKQDWVKMSSSTWYLLELLFEAPDLLRPWIAMYIYSHAEDDTSGCSAKVYMCRGATELVQVPNKSLVNMHDLSALNIATRGAGGILRN